MLALRWESCLPDTFFAITKNGAFLIILYKAFTVGMMAILGAGSLIYFLILLLFIGVATKLVDVILNATVLQIFPTQKDLS